jgi:hypothetical protein
MHCWGLVRRCDEEIEQIFAMTATFQGERLMLCWANIRPVPLTFLKIVVLRAHPSDVNSLPASEGCPFSGGDFVTNTFDVSQD